MNTNSLNYKWIIALLSVIVILLISLLYILWDSPKSEDVLKYLEFFGTLLSILLSIFAIIYSFTSMIESNRQWGHISAATEVIQQNTEQTRSSYKQLLKFVNELHIKVSHIDGVIAASNFVNNTSLKKYQEINNNNIEFPSE